MVSEKRSVELQNITQLEDFINKNVKEEKESKELFSNKDIEVKTDLTEEEISIIARLKFLCDQFDLKDFRSVLIYFMELRLSKGRKSRKEFIDSIRKENHFLGLNGANNIGGFNNGRIN